MNPFIALIGSLAWESRYMLARELLAESAEAQNEIRAWIAKHRQFRDCDLTTAAAVMLRRYEPDLRLAAA